MKPKRRKVPPGLVFLFKSSPSLGFIEAWRLRNGDGKGSCLSLVCRRVGVLEGRGVSGCVSELTVMLIHAEALAGFCP